MLVLAVLVVAGLSSAARADDDEAGKRLFRRGEDFIKAGNYRAAAEAFEEGYAAAPRVGFLVNIGNCYRKLGELGRARQFYQRFLDAAPADHPSRTEVADYLRAMDQIEADGVKVEDAAPVLTPAPDRSRAAAAAAAATARADRRAGAAGAAHQGDAGAVARARAGLQASLVLGDRGRRGGGERWRVLPHPAAGNALRGQPWVRA
jgi:tetratricopeptide (TPR) repeat protein